MISQDQLKHLAALASDDGIVSAFIGIEPRLRFERNQHVVKFKGAVKRLLREQNDDRTREIVNREYDAIVSYLEGHEPAGRTLAIFACTPASIWETVELDVRVPTMVHVDRTTSTRALAAVLDEYPRYAVVIIQRDRGEIFIAEQRSAAGAATVESNVPGQHSAGGWAQARFERHIETHVDRHFASVLEELRQLATTQPFSRLAVGGTHENVTDFVQRLDEPLRSRVIGTFSVEFKTGSEEEMLDRAREVLHAHERTVEQELLEDVVDAAEADGQGALGIDDVLTALAAGRVDTLVVAAGMTHEGSECLSCGRLAPTVETQCSVCGAPIDEDDAGIDVIDRAAEHALLSSARVEVVTGVEERDRLIARGGIGARLRY